MTPCIDVLPLFSAKALRLAREIVQVRRSDQQIVEALKRELVMPLINRIDFITGLSNRPDYIAWRLLHLLREP